MADPALNLLIRARNRSGPAFRGLNKSLDLARSKTAGLTKALVGVGATYLGFRAVASAVTKTINEVDTLGKRAEGLRVRFKSLQVLYQHLQLAGLGAEQADLALRTFRRRLDEATTRGGQAAAVLERLGVEFKAGENTSRDYEAVLRDVFDAFSRLDPALVKVTDSQTLFGDDVAVRMIPALRGGTAALDDTRRAMEALGQLMDAQVARNMARLNDQLTETRTSLRVLRSEIVDQFAPQVGYAAQTLNRVLLAPIIQGVRELEDIDVTQPTLIDRFVLGMLMGTKAVVIALDGMGLTFDDVGNRMDRLAESTQDLVNHLRELTSYSSLLKAGILLGTGWGTAGIIKEVSREIDIQLRDNRLRNDLASGLGRSPSFWGRARMMATRAIPWLGLAASVGAIADWALDGPSASASELRLPRGRIAGDAPGTGGGRGRIFGDAPGVGGLAAERAAGVELQREIDRGIRMAYERGAGAGVAASPPSQPPAADYLDQLIADYQADIAGRTVPGRPPDPYAGLGSYGRGFQQTLDELAPSLKTTASEFSAVMANGIRRAFEDGGRSGIDVLEEHFVNVFIRNVAARLTSVLGGLLSALGLDEGPLSGIFNLFGSPTTPPTEGKALGGSVVGGRPYIVGERGPELFVPGASGSIVANRSMGMGITIVNNIDSPSVADPEETLRLADAITERTIESIRTMARNGRL